MSVMSHAGTSRPFTVDDLEDMPDDGRRYELIDGELLVSPAPRWEHQELLLELALQLRPVCPRMMRVVIAPFAVQQDEFNEVQPDLLVARYEDLTSKNLPVAPLLAVEVLSPSSRITDPTTKKAFYERMGVPRFWLVDPRPDEPSLTVFGLTAEGGYEQLAHVAGASAYDADQPFAVRIVPGELVAGLRP